MQLNTVVQVQLDELNALARCELGDEPAPVEARSEPAIKTRAMTDLCLLGAHGPVCSGMGVMGNGRHVQCNCACHG